MSLKLKSEEKFSKRIQNEFKYNFEIAESGLYVLEISGRAKGWWQNLLRFISFFQDDDLAVKIDGRGFPKLGGKRGWFDGPAAWNGNQLKGLQQVNVVFVYFESGRHTLHFITDQSPLLETIKIYQAKDERNIVLTTSQHYLLERGNGRPWLCFVFIDLDLERLTIQARADCKESDDDDLQLRINGERQPNDNPRAHQYWYWCGRVLKGQSKTFDQKLNLAAGLNYIELWADNAPVVGRIVFALAEQKSAAGDVGRIALYTDVTSEKEAINLRARPNTASQVLAQIPNQARIAILQKAVVGEPLFEDYLSDIWHQVSYQGVSGFVHSSLMEIRGQERETIVAAIKTKAKELGLDEKLALNLAHCESKWLPFVHSETDNKGIYQLGASTIEEINKKHGGNVTDPWDIYQNIDGGLRYFRYLLKEYVAAPDGLTRTIAAWNAGTKDVPKTGSFNVENYEPQVGELVHCTLEERRGENTLKYVKFLMVALTLGAGFWLFYDPDSYKNLNASERYLARAVQMPPGPVTNYSLTEEEDFPTIHPTEGRGREKILGHIETDMDGDGQSERITFSFYSPEPFYYDTYVYAPSGEKITLNGSLWQAFVDDLTGDGRKELVVQLGTGQLRDRKIFAYREGQLKLIPVFDENGRPAPPLALATSMGINFDDLDSNGTKEIVLQIRDYSHLYAHRLLHYYRWNGKGFILYNEKDIAPEIRATGGAG